MPQSSQSIEKIENNFRHSSTDQRKTFYETDKAHPQNHIPIEAELHTVENSKFAFVSSADGSDCLQFPVAIWTNSQNEENSLAFTVNKLPSSSRIVANFMLAAEHQGGWAAKWTCGQIICIASHTVCYFQTFPPRNSVDYILGEMTSIFFYCFNPRNMLNKFV